MTIETPTRPSTPSLFADALAQMTHLFETEIRLVKTEISEKISAAVKAIVVILVAAVLLLAALFIILFGIVQLVIFFGVVAWGRLFHRGRCHRGHWRDRALHRLETTLGRQPHAEA